MKTCKAEKEARGEEEEVVSSSFEGSYHRSGRITHGVLIMNVCALTPAAISREARTAIVDFIVLKILRLDELDGGDDEQ